MPTSVIDTADWRLVVPLRPALDLTGSRLTAAMTGQFGGAPAALLDSTAGSILWTPDTTSGLVDRLVLIVPRTARGEWLATGVSGRPAPVTLFFDVHRTVSGSADDAWLGRSSILVLPATDSPLVTAAGGGFQPALTAAPSSAGAVLPALATGPQGPPSSTAAVVDLAFVASVPLSGHQAVSVQADGTLAYASADLAQGVDAYVGITVGAAAAGGTIAVRASGEMVEPSWSWQPGPVYLGLGGALTQVDPLALPGAVVILVVGVATSPTRLLVGPHPPIRIG